MARNPLSCGAQCSRISLIVFNILFMLIGIALFVLGLVFRFGGKEVKEEIRPTFEDIKISDYDLYNLLNSLAIIFIIIGAIIIFFSLIGFVGAVCYVRVALVIYAILIGISLALELAGVILFFVLRGELEDAVKEGMKKSVQKANAGDPDYLKATQYLFYTYECCKVESERLDNSTKLGQASETCNIQGNNYNTDCYEALTDWLKQYQAAFVGVCIAGMVIQLLLIILACWVCRSVAKKAEMV